MWLVWLITFSSECVQIYWLHTRYCRRYNKKRPKHSRAVLHIHFAISCELRVGTVIGNVHAQIHNFSLGNFVDSHLYRSSSSSNLPNKGAIDETYGEYAASDTDVMELNDKVCSPRAND